MVYIVNIIEYAGNFIEGMNIMKLYIVKTFHRYNEVDFNSSTDAIYETFDEALNCVLQNRCDISDAGDNQYACICEIELGCYPIADEKVWFIWDKVAKEYVRSVRPEFMELYCFSL